MAPVSKQAAAVVELCHAPWRLLIHPGSGFSARPDCTPRLQSCLYPSCCCRPPVKIVLVEPGKDSYPELALFPKARDLFENNVKTMRTGNSFCPSTAAGFDDAAAGFQSGCKA